MKHNRITLRGNFILKHTFLARAVEPKRQRFV